MAAAAFICFMATPCFSAQVLRLRVGSALWYQDAERRRAKSVPLIKQEGKKERDGGGTIIGTSGMNAVARENDASCGGQRGVLRRMAGLAGRMTLSGEQRTACSGGDVKKNMKKKIERRVGRRTTSIIVRGQRIIISSTASASVYGGGQSDLAHRNASFAAARTHLTAVNNTADMASSLRSATCSAVAHQASAGDTSNYHSRAPYALLRFAFREHVCRAVFAAAAHDGRNA